MLKIMRIILLKQAVTQVSMTMSPKWAVVATRKQRGRDTVKAGKSVSLGRSSLSITEWCVGMGSANVMGRSDVLVGVRLLGFDKQNLYNNQCREACSATTKKRMKREREHGNWMEREKGATGESKNDTANSVRTSNKWNNIS